MASPYGNATPNGASGAGSPYATATPNGAGGLSGSAYANATPAASAAAKPSGGGFWHDIAHGFHEYGPAALATSAAHVASGLGQAGYDLGKTIYEGDKGVVTGNQKEQQAAANTVGAYAKGVAHDYATRYGPLAHGHVGQFSTNLLHDPIPYLLDAASVATLGGAGAAKAGSLLARAGVVSNASKLARLGAPVDLTVPDFKGEELVVKQSSANPVIRARQVAVNSVMNKLPQNTPVVGSAARVVKVLSRPAERAGAHIRIDMQPFQQAFAKLSNPERAAWHMTARGVTPQQWKDLLTAQPENTRVSKAFFHLLDNPKVAALVERPSKNLADALAKGRALSDQMTAQKVAAGHITETAAAETPYRLMRLVNGATIHPETGAITDQAGREIPNLAKELADGGKEQPFYVPDSMVTKGSGGYRFRSRATGLAEPGAGGSGQRNLGRLVQTGHINLHGDALSAEAGMFASRTEAQVLHDELVKAAAELPRNEPLPHGYEFLKLNRGEASAPFIQRGGGEFEHALEPGTADRYLTTDAQDGEIATRHGNRLIVPASARDILESRALSYRGAAAKLLYQQPTNVWKHLVLGLRPAFFGNITVGNSILGALQSAPGFHGVAGWLNQVVPKAERVLGSKVTAQTMRDVFPEQATGTFGHQMGFTANKGLRVASKAYQGVMPATIAYENVLRRAMVEGWAKASPEVQAAMRANGGDVNAALRDVAKTHPHIINEISKRVDDALGNYRTYNKFERAIKQLIPFYGWDRHIVRSVARLVSERPALVDALGNLGEVGHQRQEQGLGPMPSYAAGEVRLPGLPGFLGPLNGRVPVLNTQSLNPFNTAADLAGILPGLFGAAHGTGSSELTSGLNPILQAFIEQSTGRSLLSGAALHGNAFLNELKNIPQLSEILAATGNKPATKPTSLYQNDWQTLLASLLGAPIKKVNLPTAHLYAAQEKSGKLP